MPIYLLSLLFLFFSTFLSITLEHHPESTSITRVISVTTGGDGRFPLCIGFEPFPGLDVCVIVFSFGSHKYEMSTGLG